MKIRWTQDALDELDQVYDYIANDNPTAAAETCGRVLATLDALEDHPLIGRAGRIPGTREIVIAPFIVVYAVTREAVEILALIHGARKWPDSL